MYSICNISEDEHTTYFFNATTADSLAAQPNSGHTH